MEDNRFAIKIRQWKKDLEITLKKIVAGNNNYAEDIQCTKQN